MLPPAEAERITGYHVGGISPFGQKRAPRLHRRDALAHPTVIVNGGRRGLQIEIAPADLVEPIAAKAADSMLNATADRPSISCSMRPWCWPGALPGWRFITRSAWSPDVSIVWRFLLAGVACWQSRPCAANDCVSPCASTPIFALLGLMLFSINSCCSITQPRPCRQACCRSCFSLASLINVGLAPCCIRPRSIAASHWRPARRSRDRGDVLSASRWRRIPARCRSRIDALRRRHAGLLFRQHVSSTDAAGGSRSSHRAAMRMLYGSAALAIYAAFGGHAFTSNGRCPI